jgi:hypothetical protein
LTALSYSAAMNRSTSTPPFASITRLDATLSTSVVIVTWSSPSAAASGSSSANACVAYPRRRFHGTTA